MYGLGPHLQSPPLPVISSSAIPLLFTHSNIKYHLPMIKLWLLVAVFVTCALAAPYEIQQSLSTCSLKEASNCSHYNSTNQCIYVDGGPFKHIFGACFDKYSMDSSWFPIITTVSAECNLDGMRCSPSTPKGCCYTIHYYNEKPSDQYCATDL